MAYTVCDLFEILAVDLDPDSAYGIKKVEGGVSITLPDFPQSPCVVRQASDGMYIAAFGKCTSQGRKLAYALDALSSKCALAEAAIAKIKALFRTVLRDESEAEFGHFVRRIRAQYRERSFALYAA